MERVSGRQITLLGAGYVLDATLMSVPAQIIGAAQQDAWLSYIPAMLVILAVMWMLSRVSQRFPERDLFAAMIERFSVIGRVLTLLYVLFFFLILVRDLRALIDFANITLLPNTPLTVIMIMAVITIIQMSIGGVEIMARMTELIIVPLFVMIALLPTVLIKDVQIAAITPFLEKGIGDTLQGSWYAIGYIGEVIVIPLLFTGGTYRFRQGLFALLIGTGTLELLILMNIMVLGPYLSSISVYPNMELIRQIRVTDFLDRFDLPIAAVWLASMMIKLSISLHVVCHGLKRAVPSLSAQLTVPPMGLLAGVSAFWFFQNTVQLLHLNRTWPVIALFFMVALPIVIFLIVRPKKTKKEAKEVKQAS
ncbi:MAG: endospore germination permease [Tumebacillaceae bacterium]